jgi:hypothetical protein
MGGYKLQLNINTGLVTGKGTYECKDVLKSKWKATYDPKSKGWILKKEDISMFIEQHEDKNAPAQEVKKVEKTSTYWDGLCPKCHSYCYGDCLAN